MSEGVSNPKSTQNLVRRENFAPAIPDIPAGADISQAALRQILQALRNNVNQLYGDGPRSAMTLERAVESGIVEPKPPGSGGARPNIDPRTGYGAVTWSGHRVPPPPEVVIGEPSTVSSLAASAGFSGVYLTWSSPNRSGGSFEIYRAETNSRAASYRIATVTGLSYYDSTVAPEIVGDGTATGKQYYYWVKSISIKEDGSLGDAFYWSGDEDEGVPWTLNPNTFSRIVADSILAGSLHVAIDFSTDGAIRSGKEIVDGVPNTAAGFYINGNNFYFGSDGDGSYIRWNGASLEIKGTLTGSYIYGGVIDGAVLSGNYLFVRDLIYDRTDIAMPDNGTYQSSFTQAEYETSYLVRNQITQSDTVSVPRVTPEAGGAQYASFTSTADPSSDSDGDPTFPWSIPVSFDFASINTRNRADDNTLELVFTCSCRWIEFLSFLGFAPCEISISRTYDSGVINDLFVMTTTDSGLIPGGSFATASNDPLYPAAHVYPNTSETWTFDFDYLSYMHSGVRSDGVSFSTITPFITQDPSDGGIIFPGNRNGVGQIRFPLSSHSGRLTDVTVSMRGVNALLHTNVIFVTQPESGFRFEVDNTV